MTDKKSMELSMECLKNISKYDLVVYVHMLSFSDQTKDEDTVKISSLTLTDCTKIARSVIYECLFRLEHKYFVLKKISRTNTVGVYSISKHYEYFKDK